MKNNNLDDLLRIRSKRTDKNLSDQDKAYNEFAYLVTTTKYLNMSSDDVLRRNPRYNVETDHPGWTKHVKRAYKNAQTYSMRKYNV